MKVYLCCRHAFCIGPNTLLSAGAVCVPVVVIIHSCYRTSVRPEDKCSIIFQAYAIKIIYSQKSDLFTA